MGKINKIYRVFKEALLNMLFLRKIVKEETFKQFQINNIRINLQNSVEIGITDSLYDGKELIVSLTSYNRRIFQVSLVLESLLEQTLKPNRIILWLDRDEFSEESDLPLTLLSLKKRGVQIEYCDNLKSYKKLIPTLERYPDSLIITADDDIIYPNDFVERLYKSYKHHPDEVNYYRGHRMKFANGELLPYNKWDIETEKATSSIYNFPTGCGGVIYTRELLDNEICKPDIFLNIASTADDVWFKAMSLKKGVKCRQVELECPFRDKFIFLDAMDDMGLANINLIGNKNDEQIQAVFSRYNLYDILKSE